MRSYRILSTLLLALLTFFFFHAEVRIPKPQNPKRLPRSRSQNLPLNLNQCLRTLRNPNPLPSQLRNPNRNHPSSRLPTAIGPDGWHGKSPFKRSGSRKKAVEVEFLWFDYAGFHGRIPAGQVDAVCMTNGDALVTGATGKPSVGIM